MKEILRFVAVYCILCGIAFVAPDAFGASRRVVLGAVNGGSLSALSSSAAWISTSGNHTVAVRDDGSVWAWGYNAYGQLGDGTTTTRKAPVQVVGLSNVVAVAAGYYHSFALRDDGTLWAWGYNALGQLGDGTTVNRMTPVQVAGLSDSDGIVSIAAGGYHSMALSSSGAVWAWGYNSYGDLGVATGNMYQKVPAVVVGLDGVNAVAAGQFHSMALRYDGSVWAWGKNSSGQVGDGTTTNRSTPVQVLSGMAAMAAGGVHSLALGIDGVLWAWGDNRYGQIGDGTTSNRTTPVEVLASVSAAAGGHFHTLAIRGDATVWGWGSNLRYQLGEGGDRYVPTKVDGVASAAHVAAGSEHSMSVSMDGAVWAWGASLMGQLGAGSTVSYSSTPLQVQW